MYLRTVRHKKKAGINKDPGFQVWWRWAESNRRPKALHARHYMLSPLFDLGWRQHNVRSTPTPIPAKFEPRLAGRRRGLSCDDDPTSTSTGTSGFRAYALSGESVVVVVGNYEFCSWISEESYPLGMRQTISQPPSKPVHPRVCRYVRPHQYRGDIIQHQPRALVDACDSADEHIIRERRIIRCHETASLPTP